MHPQVVRLLPADLPRIDALRTALWPHSPLAELQAIVAARPEYVVLAALGDDGSVIGFAEVSTRCDYVEGCETSPVAFVEGIFVAPAHRHRGVGRTLLAAAEQFARDRGLAELASNALLDNEASHAFHAAAGFAETERVVYFRRVLEPAGA